MKADQVGDSLTILLDVANYLEAACAAYKDSAF